MVSVGRAVPLLIDGGQMGCLVNYAPQLPGICFESGIFLAGACGEIMLIPDCDQRGL